MVEDPKLEDFELVVDPDLTESETKNKWHQVGALEPADFEFQLTQQDLRTSLPPIQGGYSDSTFRWIRLTALAAHVLRLRTLWSHIGNNLKQYAAFQTPEVKAKKERAKANRLTKQQALQDGGSSASTSRHSRGSKK